jgi:hypothetical protein
LRSLRWLINAPVFTNLRAETPREFPRFARLATKFSKIGPARGFAPRANLAPALDARRVTRLVKMVKCFSEIK